MADTDVAEDVAELEAMSDDEFLAAVSECVDDGSYEEWEALLAPTVARRTKAAIKLLFVELNGRAAGRWTPADHARRAHLQRRAEHASRAVAAAHQTLMRNQASEDRASLARLTCAVQDHRLASINSGLAPETHDRDLWAVLDEVTVKFGREHVTLTAALARNVWTKEPDHA